MITIRKSEDRGHFDHGWLNTYHTFSFAAYHDPRHMGFSVLRVINDDTVQAGSGFGMHPHRDMEIVTYILSGALEHKDSMGTGSVIRRGDVQIMSAGTGVQHSEFNHDPHEPVHLLQIWMFPSAKGLKPSYQQKTFSDPEKSGVLMLIVSPDKENDALFINQDARLYASALSEGQEVSADIDSSRSYWIQLALGSARINGIDLNQGDGAALTDEHSLEVVATGSTELLMFDLP